MRFGVWCFYPKLLPGIATAVIFSIFMALGFWQLDRAARKESAYLLYQQRNTAPARMLTHDGLDLDELLWRKITVTGVYGRTNYLLDNQVYQGQAGYLVYTPLRLEHSNTWVLINRGWLVAGVTRDSVPDVQPAKREAVTVTGTAKPPPSPGMILSDDITEDLGNGLYRIQRIDPAVITDTLGGRLLPLVIRLDAASDSGFSRDWHISGSGKAKHLAYAFQWFAFALVLLIIYVIVHLKKEETFDD